MMDVDVLPVPGVPDVDGLAIWHQQSGEGSRPYHAFVAHFLALPPWDRSLVKAYRHHQTICKHSQHPPKWASPEWAGWRFKFNWTARVAAYDAHCAARTRLQALHAIDQMNQRQIDLAMQLQQQIAARLQQIVTSGEVAQMSLLQMAHLLDKAAIIERRARNLPGEIVQHVNEDGGDLLDLSALSAEQLSVFEHLINLAQTRTLNEKGSGDADQ